MVWGIFSISFLVFLVPIEYSLNATAYLSIVASHVHPFMTTVYTSSEATSSRIMHHVTKLKSSQTGFLNMTMTSLYSNGLHSHRSQSNRAALWCCGTGDSHHGCAADKSAVTAWCYHVNMDQNLWGMFQHLVESIPRRIKAVLKAGTSNYIYFSFIFYKTSKCNANACECVAAGAGCRFGLLYPAVSGGDSWALVPVGRWRWRWRWGRGIETLFHQLSSLASLHNINPHLRAAIMFMRAQNEY